MKGKGCGRVEGEICGRGNMWKGGKGMEEGRCVMLDKGKHIKGGMRKYGVN